MEKTEVIKIITNEMNYIIDNYGLEIDKYEREDIFFTALSKWEENNNYNKNDIKNIIKEYFEEVI